MCFQTILVFNSCGHRQPPITTEICHHLQEYHTCVRGTATQPPQNPYSTEMIILLSLCRGAATQTLTTVPISDYCQECKGVQSNMMKSMTAAASQQFPVVKERKREYELGGVQNRGTLLGPTRGPGGPLVQQQRGDALGASRALVGPLPPQQRGDTFGASRGPGGPPPQQQRGDALGTSRGFGRPPPQQQRGDIFDASRGLGGSFPQQQQRGNTFSASRDPGGPPPQQQREENVGPLWGPDEQTVRQQREDALKVLRVLGPPIQQQRGDALSASRGPGPPRQQQREENFGASWGRGQLTAPQQREDALGASRALVGPPPQQNSGRSPYEVDPDENDRSFEAMMRKQNRSGAKIWLAHLDRGIAEPVSAAERAWIERVTITGDNQGGGEMFGPKGFGKGKLAPDPRYWRRTLAPGGFGPGGEGKRKESRPGGQAKVKKTVRWAEGTEEKSKEHGHGGDRKGKGKERESRHEGEGKGKERESRHEGEGKGKGRATK